MSNIVIDHEKGKLDGHLGDEFIFREINRIAGLDEIAKPRHKSATASRIWEISCLVFFYATSIAVVVVGVFHETGGFVGKFAFP